MPRPKPTAAQIEERFWSRVDIRGPDDCWLWTGDTGVRMGYGRIRIDGRGVRAHRYAYSLRHGSIADGLCVLHRCDNPPCVNHAHLFLGTVADNISDMVAKSRQRGGRPPKLTEADVCAIRELIGKKSRREIAKQFGIDTSTISNIATGKTWSEVGKSGAARV